MLCLLRRTLAVIALILLLSSPTVSANQPGAGVIPAPAGDGLSGTWQVSRSCKTICVSPAPVLKVVHHWHDAVFETNGRPPQVLYQIGMQVLVYGPKDASVLTIRTRGQLMSGSGVGADGSTFETTWRCVSSAIPTVTTPSATPTATVSPSVGNTGPGAMIANFARGKAAQTPMAMGLC